MKLAIFGVLLLIGGIALLWIYAGWQTALGAYLLVWANNLGQK